MEPVAAIIVLIVILGLTEKFSKAAKRNRNAPADEPPRRPVQRMPSKPMPSKPANPIPAKTDPLRKIADADATQEIAAVLKAFVQPQPAVPSKPVARMQSGESVTDADGCVGGSLGAHSEEGESRAEHAVHELRRSASVAEETATVATARRIDVKQLRQAVVMSEILDKPKALRRRH